MRLKRPSFDAAQLKWIALLSMTIDHISALLFLPALGPTPPHAAVLFGLGMRAVGRLAFPIYAFLLVEGFFHTRSRSAYFVRLAGFALLAEIPYDLAWFGCPFDGQRQNVLFTLALGLLTLVLLERAASRPLLDGLALASGCAAAVLLRTEYDAVGILLIALFSLVPRFRGRGLCGAGLLLAWETRNLCCAGVLALLPVSCYNGRRGRLLMPLFFYWYYPVHLLLFWAAR